MMTEIEPANDEPDPSTIENWFESQLMLLDFAQELRGSCDSTFELGRLFNPLIADESDAWAGIARRREQLEEAVAPYASPTPSLLEIRFRGQRRYLKALPRTVDYMYVWLAMKALQAIYTLEDAVEDGDLPSVARMAYALGKYDRDILAADYFKVRLGTDVIALMQNQKRGRQKAGKTKLNARDEMIVQTSYARNGHRKDWLKATTAEVRQRTGKKVDPKTVRRCLDKLGINTKSRHLSARPPKKKAK